MTYREWPIPRKLLTEIGQIQAYGKQALADPETSITVIGCHRQVSLLNLKRGFDETGSLKPSLPGTNDSILSSAGIYSNFKLTFRGLKNTGKTL
jgi:hypothetical protein